ncbi:MAG: TetR/AcrR family transcriptional regulator [Planctomycetes bacterium]|jgi:AcrR family transcriptional regulator|nr:TetR/AcrR family transcriptional regulator [Planctomycetota bacterium]
MARSADPHLRARLIDAATAEFAESGYAGATLDGIALRAGVTKGGVYFHFAGKEELFFAVLDHWRELRRRQLQVPAIGPQGAAVALRSFLSNYLAFHFREPAATHLLRVLATELRGRFTARLREDDRQEQRWLRACVRDLLVQGIHDGSLFVDDPALSAFVLAAAVTGVLEQWHTAPADVEAHCHEEELARMLLARYATGSRGSLAAEARSEYDFREPTDP